MASWIYSTPSKEDTNNGNKGRSNTVTPNPRARSATYLSSRGQFANTDVHSQRTSQVYARDNTLVTGRSVHSNSFLNIRPYAAEKFKSAVGRRTFLAQIRGSKPGSSNENSIVSPEDPCCLSSSTSTSATSPSDSTSPDFSPPISFSTDSISFSTSSNPNTNSSSTSLSKFIVTPDAFHNNFSPPTDRNTQSLSYSSAISSSIASPSNALCPMEMSASSSSMEAEDMSRTSSNTSISCDSCSTQDDGRICDEAHEQGDVVAGEDEFDDWERIIDSTVPFLISENPDPLRSAPGIQKQSNPQETSGALVCGAKELSSSVECAFELNAIGGPWPLPRVFDDYRLRTFSGNYFQSIPSDGSSTPELELPASSGSVDCTPEDGADGSAGGGPDDTHANSDVDQCEPDCEHECEGKCEVSDSHSVIFMVDDKPKLKAADLMRIVTKLTCDTHNDTEFTEICLLTYRMFTDPQTLFSYLRRRYESTKNDKVRLKVCKVLKQWLENNEFGGENCLLSSIALFLETVSLDYPMSAIQLKRITEKSSRLSNAVVVKWPLQHSLHTVSGLDAFDALEVARQLSLMEFEWFSKIRPEELLEKKWAQSKHDAPNICSMIARSNTIPFWVATEIVQRDNLEERVAILRKFICIADHCRVLCNYNALMEILSGLSMTAIHRLKKTWGALPPKVLTVFRELNQLMSPDSNFKAYRELLKKVATTTQPRVPYLGRYLTDLVFTDDAMPLHLPNGLVNFWKCKSIAHIIWDLIAHQKQMYTFLEVPQIQSYLQESKGLTESALLKLSRKLEPKVSNG